MHIKPARLTLSLCLLLLISCFNLIVAQERPSARSGTPSAPSAPEDKAGITGIVSFQGGPLMGVIVRITMVADRERVEVEAMTNAKGIYKMAGLAPGTYKLSVRKKGFLTDATEQANNKQVVLTSGTQSRVNIPMEKGGVIEGLVTDADSNPLAGITVAAVTVVARTGSRPASRPQPEVYGVTDDKGRYRIYGLQPGAYNVVTNLRDISGVWTMLGPLYYPDKREAAAAMPVSVAASQEAKNINFSLDLNSTSAFSVSGSVKVGGKILPAPIALKVSKVGDKYFKSVIWTDNQGQFKASGLTSGVYRLRTATDPQRFLLSSLQEITMVDKSLTGVEINVEEAALLSGKVVLQDKGVERPYASVRVFLHEAKPKGVAIDCKFIKPGEFNVRLMARGMDNETRKPFLWRFSEWPDGIYLKAIILRDEDITYEPLGLKSNEGIAGLKLVFSTGAAIIEGQVGTPAEAGGQTPASKYNIFAFPTDPKKFSSKFYNRHLVATAGETFQIKNLRPGSYYVVAMLLDPLGPKEPIKGEAVKQAIEDHLLGPETAVNVTASEVKKNVLPLILKN